MSPFKNDPRIVAALQESIKLGEYGIAVSAYHKGELIVDCFDGLANTETKKPVDSNTLFPVFSVTKGVTALAIHVQADRGLLEYNAPIAKYWPEFGKNGKEATTVEQALSHRAGIPQMPDGVTPELMHDWAWMIKHIADFTPIFPPGTANAYHILVWGWILGEVVVRTDPTRRPFDVFVKEEILEPLRIKDFHLGVPSEKLSNVATLYGGNSFDMVDDYNISPTAVFPGSTVHNIPIVQQTVDPGAGAITTAPAVARIFALIANEGELDGVRLLSKDRVAGLSRLREGAHDPDKILTVPVWFGAAGYWLGGEEGKSDPIVGDHRDIIYSPGAGGSLAFADLRDSVAVAICHNNMDTVAIYPERTYTPIMKAIREIVAEREKATKL
ncbi:Beta-lactamase domain-containing protein 2 [Cyphellophora attinorum]|uniref:Beta-lactamase domain-containing protein 2 n=1 Tax=Cyphellophora attinorum TaxID=1664694 RepID=A0A0N1H7X0_9EURO|nr:Beta-lactamase domain-containing protein 2 [Phialophora attinorum]KPI42806.1 Beta-lactamase domain-containing protein 2 [Phialophora attinorum]